MEYDVSAIIRAYPNKIKKIDETGIYDFELKPFTVDQTLVDAARVEIDKEYYKVQRQREYPDTGTQFDYIYHNGIDKWKADMVDPVKAKYPKPE